LQVDGVLGDVAHVPRLRFQIFSSPAGAHLDAGRWFDSDLSAGVVDDC
jgi:hypothetical protein